MTDNTPETWHWVRGDNGQGYEDTTLRTEDGAIVLAGDGWHGSGDLSIEIDSPEARLIAAAPDLLAAAQAVLVAYKARTRDVLRVLGSQAAGQPTEHAVLLDEEEAAERLIKAAIAKATEAP